MSSCDEGGKRVRKHVTKLQKLNRQKSSHLLKLNASFEGPSNRHAQDLPYPHFEEEADSMTSTTCTRITRGSEELEPQRTVYSRVNTFTSLGDGKLIKRLSIGHISFKRKNTGLHRTASLCSGMSSSPGNPFPKTKYFHMMENAFIQVHANSESAQDYVDQMKKADYMWRVYVTEISEEEAQKYGNCWQEYDLRNPEARRNLHEVSFEPEQSVQIVSSEEEYRTSEAGNEVQITQASLVEREFSKLCDMDFERQKSRDRTSYRHSFTGPLINAVTFRELRKNIQEVRTSAPFSVSRLGQEVIQSNMVQVRVELNTRHVPEVEVNFRLVANYDPSAIEKFKIIKLLIPSNINAFVEREVYLKVGFSAASTKKDFVLRTKKMTELLSSIERNTESAEKLERIKSNMRTTSETFSGFLSRYANGKFETQLAFGSIISRLLDHTSELKPDLEETRLKKKMNKGKEKLRFVVFQPVKWNNFRKVLIEMAGSESIEVKLERLKEKHSIIPFSLSEQFDTKKAKTHQIDYFVSHCWQDDPIAKFDKLCELSVAFKQKYKRYPRLWIDVFCISQKRTEVEESLSLLPVYLMACKKFLVLKTERYFTRLWCLAELLPRYIMSCDKDIQEKKIIQYICLDGKDLPDHLDISEAQCGKIEDQKGVTDFLFNIPGITRKEIGNYVLDAMHSGKKLEFKPIDPARKDIFLDV